MLILHVLLGLLRYQVCLEDEHCEYTSFQIAIGIDAVQMPDGIQWLI